MDCSFSSVAQNNRRAFGQRVAQVFIGEVNLIVARARVDVISRARENRIIGTARLERGAAALLRVA